MNLTPTTGATAAERRVFDGAGTDPPESGGQLTGGSVPVPCCGA